MTRAEVFATRAGVFMTPAEVFATAAGVFMTRAGVFTTSARVFMTPADVFTTLIYVLTTSAEQFVAYAEIRNELTYIKTMIYVCLIECLKPCIIFTKTTTMNMVLDEKYSRDISKIAYAIRS